MSLNIDNLNKSFDELTTYLDESAKQLEGKSQEEVDEQIETVINPMVNSRLVSVRQAVIDSFKPVYASFQKLIDLISPLSSMSVTDLGSVISFITGLKGLLTMGLDTAIPTITVEMPQMITSIMGNITKLVNYKMPKLPDIPSKENPEIMVSVNTDKLAIECEPITMADITD